MKKLIFVMAFIIVSSRMGHACVLEVDGNRIQPLIPPLVPGQIVPVDVDGGQMMLVVCAPMKGQVIQGFKRVAYLSPNSCTIVVNNKGVTSTVECGSGKIPQNQNSKPLNPGPFIGGEAAVNGLFGCQQAASGFETSRILALKQCVAAGWAANQCHVVSTEPGWGGTGFCGGGVRVTMEGKE